MYINCEDYQHWKLEVLGSSPGIPTNAIVAQMGEQVFRKDPVAGSMPVYGSETEAVSTNTSYEKRLLYRE